MVGRCDSRSDDDVHRFMHLRMSCSRCSGHYLKRSAHMLRDTVQPALDSSLNGIDRNIRLVFTGKGPEYQNADVVGASLVASRHDSRVHFPLRATDLRCLRPIRPTRLGIGRLCHAAKAIRSAVSRKCGAVVVSR